MPIDLTLQVILTVVAGIGALVVAEFLQVPGIVFLLLFGIALGPSGLGFLHPELLGAGLEAIVALLVAIILFEGGFNLQLRELGQVSGSLRNLVTWGALITLLGGAAAAHWLSDFPWPIAFLYAALVVVTGPTVINSLMKQVKVDRQVSTLLEGEGVLIDPIGAILAVVILNVVLNGNTNPAFILSDLVFRLGLGGGIGIGGGWLMAQILKRGKFLSEDLKTLVVLAGVWGLFGLAQTLRSEAGLMATVASGIVLRASEVPEARLLKRFKGQLTILAIAVLFILLAADLSIASLVALGWEGIATVLVLMLVVRPVSVWICTWNSDLNWRQKIFLGWISPRGIVSASVASLFAILLTEAGINGGDSIKALVFLTIILTVFLQALSAQVMANWLGITARQETGVVIVGCNALSLLLARLFLERGEAVALIDTEPEAARVEEQEGLRVFRSTALDAGVLAAAGLDRAGTFVAMTDNGEVNAVLAQRAAEEFRPPRVLAVFPIEAAALLDSTLDSALELTAAAVTPLGSTKLGSTKLGSTKLGSTKLGTVLLGSMLGSTQGSIPKAHSPNVSASVKQAFALQVELSLWNPYLQEGAVKLGETRFEPETALAKTTHLKELVAMGTLLPLAVEREGELMVAAAEGDWRVADRLIYLLHDPKPKLLRLLSGGTQGQLILETLAEIEAAPVPTSVEPMVEALLEEAMTVIPAVETDSIETEPADVNLTQSDGSRAEVSKIKD